MNEIEIEITEILGTGECPAGHKVGDVFRYPGGCGELCPMAMHVLFPAVRVYQFGGAHPWEKQPGRARMCCSDPDNAVVFEVRVV